MAEPQKRIEELDFLRGFAALSVCWYHFAGCNPAFLSEGFLYSSSRYGWLGVEIFFVISGFIIPYALHRGGYRLASYPIFLWKRIIRLDPPYIVSIILVIILAYVSMLAPSLKRGAAFELSGIGLLLHLGYLNVFFGYEWLNTVYWTLAIEFQYYLAIGLIFPLIGSRNRMIRLATFAVLGALSFQIASEAFIFHYLFLFMMGISLFQYKVGLAGKRELALLLILFSCGSLAVMGAPQTIAGLFAVGGITLLKAKHNIFTFFGNISYSLYLVHAPIGVRVVSLGAIFATSMWMKILTLALAFATSIIAAYLLYRFVELPAQKWSSSLKYKKRTPATHAVSYPSYNASGELVKS